MSSAVCHVVYNRFPQDPRVRRESVLLSKRGYDVHVLAVMGANEPRDENWNGIHVHRIPLRAVRGGHTRYAYQYALLWLMFCAQLLTLARKHRFSLVHVHSLPDILVLAAMPVRVLLGAKVVLDMHESMPELYLARFPRARTRLLFTALVAGQRASCTAANHVITVNEYLRDLLVARGVPHERILVLPNVPDWGFERAPVSTPSSAEGPEIVIAGGLNPERDIPTVLHAAKQVLARSSFKVRVIGYGDPAYREYLLRLILDLGIQDSVRVEPEVPPEDVPNLIRRTLFGVVSYQRNPLTELATPNKVYEYARCGKAMIVPNLPALRRLLRDTVLYYEPGDASSLARQMSILLDDRTECDRLAGEVVALMRGQEWRVVGEQLVSVYSTLTASQPRRFATEA